MWILPIISLLLGAFFIGVFIVARRLSERVAIGILALLVALPLAFFWSLWIHEVHMKVRARDIRNQLEAYRAAHEKYPVSLLDLGIREVNGPIYYERDFDSPLAYHLWFEYAPHALASYDSDSKKWDYNP